MIIYLDESGDLGLNFNQKNTSRYFVMGLLVCWDDAAHSTIIRAVKRTLKNKLPPNTPELKGSRLSSPIKQYFLKEADKEKNWCLYSAIADKKTWIKHHLTNHREEPKKRILYDEIAKRLFLQLDNLEGTPRCDIVVDRSKNKDEITLFDQIIIGIMTERLPRKTKLTIRHRRSQENVELQAIDTFCAGIWRKYEKADLS